jgi:hypothetical protein
MIPFCPFAFHSEKTFGNSVHSSQMHRRRHGMMATDIFVMGSTWCGLHEVVAVIPLQDIFEHAPTLPIRCRQHFLACTINVTCVAHCHNLTFPHDVLLELGPMLKHECLGAGALTRASRTSNICWGELWEWFDLPPLSEWAATSRHRGATRHDTKNEIPDV